VKALPRTPDVLFVARRVIWFEPPERAVADPIPFWRADGREQRVIKID
jgi:hypothetical protein